MTRLEAARAQAAEVRAELERLDAEVRRLQRLEDLADSMELERHDGMRRVGLSLAFDSVALREGEYDEWEIREALSSRLLDMAVESVTKPEEGPSGKTPKACEHCGTDRAEGGAWEIFPDGRRRCPPCKRRAVDGLLDQKAAASLAESVSREWMGLPEPAEHEPGKFKAVLGRLAKQWSGSHPAPRVDWTPPPDPYQDVNFPLERRAAREYLAQLSSSSRTLQVGKPTHFEGEALDPTAFRVAVAEEARAVERGRAATTAAGGGRVSDTVVPCRRCGNLHPVVEGCMYCERQALFCGEKASGNQMKPASPPPFFCRECGHGQTESGLCESCASDWRAGTAGAHPRVERRSEGPKKAGSGSEPVRDRGERLSRASRMGQKGPEEHQESPPEGSE